MATIITRAGKGSPLTNAEVDANFTNLNNDKLETGGGTLTGPTVVNVNSSSTALRVTQAGSGAALVVEDEANPDATAFVITNSGNVGVGTPVPAVKLAISSTDAMLIPVGDNSARPSGVAGYFRYNTSVSGYEGYDGSTWDTFVGATGTQTLTNKRVSPRIGSVVSAATITPTGDTADQYNVTALAADATVAAPSGTPVSGQRLILRIKDNGVARALTWTTSSGAYRAIGVTLPTTTSAGKVTYVGCIYNAQDTFWDVVAVTTQA